MNLTELQQHRTNTKRNISRIKGVIDANGRGDGRTLSTAELKCRLGIAESYFKQILSYQTQIEALDPDDNSRGDLEELYIDIKLAIESQLGEEANISALQSPLSVSQLHPHKLPALKLPLFSGKYSEYNNFITSFKQIIDREVGLSNVEKFNHLLNCLQGQALDTVKAFQVSNENYPKALERLKSRYDNPTLIFMENITSLFELPAAAKQSSSQLRHLVDTASALYSALTSLGSDRDISHAMLIHLVIGKADDDTQRKWKESLDFTSLPTWKDCAKLLERRCQYFESIDSSGKQSTAHSSSHKVEQTKSSRKANQQRRLTFSITSAHRSCALCSSDEHIIKDCPRYKSLDAATRFEKVKKLGLCNNCLTPGHFVSKCPSTFKCKSCSARHHSSLCRKSEANSTPSSETSAIVHTHLERSSMEQVILATAVVLVRDAAGNYQLGRALLDSCSQVNFITESFSQRLRLQRKKQRIEILSIGNSPTTIKHKATSIIKSRHSDFELPLTFCVTPHISHQPILDIDVSAWNLPSNISLADEHFHKPQGVDLLLGTDCFFNILSIGQIKLKETLPILQKTLLGWIVTGKYNSPPDMATPTTASFTSSIAASCRVSDAPIYNLPACLYSTSCLLSVEEIIEQQLERLWQIDNTTINASTFTDEQAACESFYIQTVDRDITGRVIVQLPFKDDVDVLGTSYGTALRRFISLERHLQSQAEVKSNYVDFMQEYEALGHMTRVENVDLSTPHFYIPHHCVLRPSSTTTKLRVVFDASCRTSTQKSLNDILRVGPTIQNDLFTLLLRFRLYRYALTADVVKMYRQVLVHPAHRRFQLILWRPSPEEELHSFQLNTVTYGTSAAPFLAVRTLKYLADQYGDEYPLGAKIINSSFYVDDMLSGADSFHELSQIKREVTEILNKGGFELAKWHSNYQCLTNNQEEKSLIFDNSNTTSALGLTWDQAQDKFQFSFKHKGTFNERVTKRTILSLASSLFDPLGLLSPLTIKAKIIMQELWLLKLNWDESVPQNLHTAWYNLITDFGSLPSVAVPRYCLIPKMSSVQIHGFCDSSNRAYGCCLYLRSRDRSNRITVRLLTAKSRVAPIKKRSLPQLELCGAHLLAKVFYQIQSSTSKYAESTFLWSDSSIVLHWLRLHSATLSAFVGNRTAEIQELTKGCTWRHVPTKDNPADIVSRGCTVKDLHDSIWYTGPPFLSLEEDQWPCKPVHDNIDMAEVDREKRKSAFHVVAQSNMLNVIEKFSSHIYSLRVVAWIFRFYYKINPKLNISFESASLTPQELQHALWCITYLIQRHHFGDEIERIIKNREPRGALKYLNPFLNINEGFMLLKVGGRLKNADLAEEVKHPVLLPSNSQFVENYVRYLHRTNYHAGPKTLIALIRRRFWIVNARGIARRVVNSCIHCVRYRPRLLEQMMGNLPVERLTPSRPFSRVAVDYCGPINTYLRIRGRVPYKTYIAIFVCLSSKAVHIEAVSNLTTEAFIAALKRFIGRRGLPTDIFCDNATNFVGANSKLIALKNFLFHSKSQAEIVSFCSQEFVNFRFIPPRAPHFGGLWEAAVKAAKGHLERTLSGARLTFEELSTALIEIEAILNSRPIAPLSTDPSDCEALTPGHLLIGCSLKALPDHLGSYKQIDHLTHWQRITAVKQHFWQRWSHDYLNELQCRAKWTKGKANIANGSLVIVHEDHVPPQRWVMGRVSNCIPGKDGLVRVVDIKTTRGTIRRPIHKIALLPA